MKRVEWGAARMHDVLRDLHKIALHQECANLTDGELVTRFLANRDEASFAELVRNHGSMVMGVCRRMLPNTQDAEDAFQAAFLVLARRAATVTPRSAVGAWLYGVAYRTAKKVRAMNAKRHQNEERFARNHRAVGRGDEALDELLPVLDEELNRLPAKYRSAIVLCELEGRTRKEAASQLGCAEGTISGWLTRGKKMLARRFSRRGTVFTISALTRSEE